MKKKRKKKKTTECRTSDTCEGHLRDKMFLGQKPREQGAECALINVIYICKELQICQSRAGLNSLDLRLNKSLWGTC